MAVIDWVGFHLDSEKEALYPSWARGRKAFPLGAEEDEQDHKGDDEGCEEEEGQNDLNQFC